MDPGFAIGHYELGQSLVQKHMYPEAIEELETAKRLSGGSPICMSTLAYAYGVSGRRDQAQKILNNLIAQSNDSNAAEIALIYVSLDDHDRAMTWLEKGYTERFNPSILLRPGFDKLRSDSRFRDLQRRIGLPL